MVASITSCLDILPTSALFIVSIPSSFSSSASASKEPMVSAFTIIPSGLFSSFSSAISLFTSFITRSSVAASSFTITTRTCDPGSAISKSGATIFTPEAAFTVFTRSNLCSILISCRMRGFNNAFTFVTIGSSSALPTTIVSPTLSFPSYKITSIVVPRPFSSFLSNIVPTPAASK